eukprot:2991105-Rhodomonas_salina.1
MAGGAARGLLELRRPLPGIFLRCATQCPSTLCCAMSGTDLAYGAMLVCYKPTLCCARVGTDLAYGTIDLC